MSQPVNVQAVLLMVRRTVAGLQNAEHQLSLSRDLPELARRMRFKPTLPIWLRQVSEIRMASRRFDATAEKIADVMLAERLRKLSDLEGNEFDRLRVSLLQDVRALCPELARQNDYVMHTVAKMVADRGRFERDPSNEVPQG